jgi:hypothetical protein
MLHPPAMTLPLLQPPLLHHLLRLLSRTNNQYRNLRRDHPAPKLNLSLGSLRHHQSVYPRKRTKQRSPSRNKRSLAKNLSLEPPRNQPLPRPPSNRKKSQSHSQPFLKDHRRNIASKYDYLTAAPSVQHSRPNKQSAKKCDPG